MRGFRSPGNMARSMNRMVQKEASRQIGGTNIAKEIKNALSDIDVNTGGLGADVRSSVKEIVRKLTFASVVESLNLNDVVNSNPKADTSFSSSQIRGQVQDMFDSLTKETGGPSVKLPNAGLEMINPSTISDKLNKIFTQGKKDLRKIGKDVSPEVIEKYFNQSLDECFDANGKLKSLDQITAAMDSIDIDSMVAEANDALSAIE